MIESERHVNGAVSLEQRYYLGSASGNAVMYLNATRQHWSIENSLHWVLDVAFREDDSRIRKGHGAENFAILRPMALNLLKQERTTRIGMRNKRLKAGWDDAYLEKILAGMKR
jgi:predicted transposase YbfD/YdcC